MLWQLIWVIKSLKNSEKSSGLAGKISLGRSLGYSDLPMGTSEASLGSRIAPRDYPRASPSGNPLEQPCFLGRLQTCPRVSLSTFRTALGEIFPDNPFGLFTVCTRLLDYSSEVWIEHCQTYPKVYRNILKVKPRASYSSLLNEKSEKLFLIILMNFIEQIFPDNHCRLFTVYII